MFKCNKCTFLYLFWLCVAYSLGLVACGWDAEPEVVTPIKIAVLAPLSDDFGVLGQSVRNGAVLAIDEWNQRGGLLGRPIEVILNDTYCDYETAAEVANDVIDQGARFIIGGVCSDASIAISEVVLSRDALQISPATTTARLTMNTSGRVKARVFRACFTDAAQASAMAKFSVARFSAERAAILYADDSSYGATLADAFEERFVEEGGEIVARGTYDSEDSEGLSLVLEDVSATSPELLYLPGYAEIVNNVIIQARMRGITATVLGSDGWNGPQLDLEAANQSYFATHYTNSDPRSAVQSWIQLYQGKFIADPDALATLTYDTANILLSAIQAAGTTDNATVVQMLTATKFDVVSGPLAFDAFHDPVKPVVILKVQGGQFNYVDRVVP
ncbi:MAG: ABC transporter substrate-binding protein [Anaerolineae bacterium]|nr:ABC transporter substrate-binding protein [Anaerolineae bacterium]